MTAVHNDNGLGLFSASSIYSHVLVLRRGNNALCGRRIRADDRNYAITVDPVAVTYIYELYHTLSIKSTKFFQFPGKFSHREPHDIVVIAGYPAHKQRSEPLDTIRAGFIKRFAGRGVFI